MIITGITGQSGSGKTTAARFFAGKGFYHIDCDLLVHNKVYKNKELLLKLKCAFGDSCVNDAGLDRRALGRLVFSEKSAYNKLMELVVPYVVAQIKADIEEYTGDLVLIDAPMLFEYGLEKMCTYTVGVVAVNTVGRICRRDGITQKDAERRLENQKSADFYRARCDFIIENDGDIADLEKNVCGVIDRILKGNIVE